MKIAIDARESGTSTGRYIDKLVEYLYKIRPKHEIIILTKPHRVEYMRQIAPKLTILEADFKEFTFQEQLGFKKFLDDLGADLVHFGMVQQPVLYSGRSITTMHDLTTARFRNPDKNPVVFWLKQQVYKWVNRRAAKKSVQVITPSEFVKKDIVNFCSISESKITVTPESADILSKKPKAYPPLKNKQFLMYIGRPTPHKNLGRLIDAFEKLQHDHPDLYLVLAGKKDANYQQHKQTILKRGIKNVVFTGFISDDELAWLYQNAAAYCFPSLSEGFGLPAVEAMLHGAPVVSSNATCLPEVCGEAAHYFDPYSVDDMVRAIGEVLADDKLRRNLIAKGKKRAQQFSWQRMAEQTLAVYNDVVKD